MKIIPKIIILTTATFTTGCNPVKSTAEAEKSAMKFHALYNAGDYEKIYDYAHPDFKDSQAKSEIIDFIRSVRDKLGTVKSTTRTGFQAKSHNLKTNVVLTYSTEFENGSGVETFTYRIAEGNAALLGWHINSKDLIVTPNKTEGGTGQPAKTTEPKPN